MPGLIDAHVHLQPSMQAQLLENGVTTVRDLRTGLTDEGARRPAPPSLTISRLHAPRSVNSWSRRRRHCDRSAGDPANFRDRRARVGGTRGRGRGGPRLDDRNRSRGLRCHQRRASQRHRRGGGSAVGPCATIPGTIRRARGLLRNAIGPQFHRKASARVAHALLDRGMTLVPTLVRQEIRLRAGGAAPEAQALSPSSSASS